MKILVTGSAGFIGSALSVGLLKLGHTVIGVDNHNDYYDQQLKIDRLKNNKSFKKYLHYKIDITNINKLKKIFDKHKPLIVVNLAAQAGVRHSLKKPMDYITSNIIGFANILECCKRKKINHLIYASTSSVYGSNGKIPFYENDSCDHPLSVYAASKKSNESMAHAYSYLYNLPTTGLRFFTVYGPWGRPDMSPFKFTKAILSNKPIYIFNYGNHSRDFTYIDDIVNGIIKVINKKPTNNKKWNNKKPDLGSSLSPWNIYNIGNGKPVKLMDYINAIEIALNKKAKKKFLPRQPGDVLDTLANTKKLKNKFLYKSKTNIKTGVKKFIQWYVDYYKIK